MAVAGLQAAGATPRISASLIGMSIKGGRRTQARSTIACIHVRCEEELEDGVREGRRRRLRGWAVGHRHEL
jgi:hypothetical protein